MLPDITASARECWLSPFSKGQLRTSSSHEFDSLSEILIVKAQCDDVLLVPVFIIESDEGVASNHNNTAMPLPT